MSHKLISLNNVDRVFEVKDFLVLGRDPNCQIRLDTPTSSPRHCRIEKRGKDYFIRDLMSETGTFVNSTQVLEAKLRDHDQISVGGEIFDFWPEKLITDSSPFPLQSKNQKWQKELELLGPAAKTNFPVLLLGPTGTGKDVLANAIHKASKREQDKFISVNCSALTETLVESELFGHVKGSFTGAINDRKGAFETARGGTLFLDEIGDLPLSMQAKLLRALENNEIRPVGSDRTVTTDVRIIAATHQNLASKMSAGSFRTDLYYRINVLTINVPALSERMEDFDVLLGDFVREQRVRLNVEAIQKLRKHKWHGNIRELKNTISRASARYPGQYIGLPELENILEADPSTPELDPLLTPRPMPLIKEMEKEMIIKRLTVNRGNQRRTAAELGLPKSTLSDRLRYYGIDANQFKI